MMQGAPQATADHTPERQLWCAVVGRALEDALGNAGGTSSGPVRDRAIAEARAWFMGDDLDFRRACDAAGLDPDLMRDRALQLIAASSVGPAQHPMLREGERYG